MPNVNDYESVNFNLGGVWLPWERPLEDDDRAWFLYEEERFVDNNKAIHRFQRIQVERDGKLVEFDIDMGPAANFDAQGFMLIGAGVETAGNLLELAEKVRLDGGIRQAMDDYAADFDLYGEIIKQGEMMNEFARRNPRTVERLLRN